MSDFYAGLDLLADVYRDTSDTAAAPQPVPVRDSNGSLVKLYANPEDPRWSVRMWRWPNGDVRLVHSIEPAALSGPEAAQGSPSTAPVVPTALRTIHDPAIGIGGEA